MHSPNQCPKVLWRLRVQGATTADKPDLDQPTEGWVWASLAMDYLGRGQVGDDMDGLQLQHGSARHQDKPLQGQPMSREGQKNIYCRLGQQELAGQCLGEAGPDHGVPGDLTQPVHHVHNAHL